MLIPACCSLQNIFFSSYHWLKKSRKRFPSSSDIWDFRQIWNKSSANLIESFLRGSYRLDAQKKIYRSGAGTVVLWSSPDALVLKVLTYLIQQILKPFLSISCYHPKGHGGLKKAVNEVMREYPRYRFFIKTDVRSYYQSINHDTLLERLSEYVRDRNLLAYVWQFLTRTVEWGGLYEQVKKGIPRGSSLSPLLGAFYLLDLDRKMEKMDVKYFRYMDDILILSPTRCKLKEAIRVLNETFNELSLEKHPDKTSMGRTEKGFDFLGFHFSPEGLSVAEKTTEKFLARAVQLYEQEQGERFGSPSLGLYVRRWERWVRSTGVERIGMDLFFKRSSYLSDLGDVSPSSRNAV
jgi:RNA-directed DNA polymerase